jgi:subfamily B ATP-binding cassette protein MsbA
MFLPLLQIVDSSTSVSEESMGNLGFLISMAKSIGVTIRLTSILFFMLVFFVLKGVFTFYVWSYRVTLQQFFIRKLRMNLLSDINILSYERFTHTNVGRIQNTMTSEVERVSQGFIDYFQALQYGILMFVYIIFAFVVDVRFALLISIGGLLTNYTYKILYKHTKGASRKLTKDSNEYQGYIIQHIANFKYLKATGLIESFSDKIRSSILMIEDSRRKIGILSAISTGSREPLLIAVVVAVILIHVNVLSGTLGVILISLLFFYRALNSLTLMQNSWNRFLSVSGSIENMKSFQKEYGSNKNINNSNSKKSFVGLKNGLKLKNAYFSYGEHQILNGINLNIDKNMTIAFVGESGSGKTTLVNIIVGLLDLKDGSFEIDTSNIKEYNITTYQNHIGYVTQEASIFNDTIFNNVTFWAEKNDNNYKRFAQAAELSSIIDFIDSLPEKEDTLLGNNGINLSGGQRQRLSIARELYKDIDILVLDEATSALDSETEKSIQKNIENLKGKYTILIIAHRLSTIKDADKIVFFKNGVIKEIGTYDELMSASLSFKKMVELQVLTTV